MGRTSTVLPSNTLIHAKYLAPISRPQLIHSVCRPALLKFPIIPKLSDQKRCDLIPRSFTAAISQANEVIRAKFSHSTKCQMQMSHAISLSFPDQLKCNKRKSAGLCCSDCGEKSDVAINDHSESEVSEMDFFPSIFS